VRVRAAKRQFVEYCSGIGELHAPFFGRSDELERLGTAWGGARNRHAAALVIEGDPGIGKTALLESFLGRDQTHSARVLHITGFSSLADLPYAGVDRLLIDLQDEVAALPAKLRRALAVATGRETGEPPDRFQVGLALLSLLGGGGSPVLCLVDDAQLLDTASLSALAFVARRLNAEAVCMVFATRPDAAVLETLAGIELLRLEGLDTRSGVELLRARRETVLDPRLAVKVVEQLAGHPLALTDLAKHADADRLALRALSIEPLPPGTLLQGFYRREIDLLPPDSREFALVVVTDTTGNVQVVHSAAAALGLPEEAARPLERTGLIEVAEHIRFRHQLVRAAVYNSASSVDRRRAHLALEAASGEHGFSTAAAMHAAAVAGALDASVADRLEALADASGARGALLSRAGLLVRASELTPEGPVRNGRRLDAAEAAIGAGAAILARDQLDAIDEYGLAPVDQGRLLAARAMLALFVGDPKGIPLVVSQLVLAADAFGSVSVGLQQRALVNAFSYALATETATEGISVHELGERIAIGAAAADGTLGTLLRGIRAHLLLPYEEAAPLIRQTLAAARAADDDTLMQVGLCTIPLALAVWDVRAVRELSQRMIDHATSRGALQSLDTIHWTLSTFHVQMLNVTAAGQSLESVRELRRAIGYPAEHVVNGAYLAMTGVPVEIVDAVAASILPTGFAGAWTVVQAGIGSRLIADGDYQQAYERLGPIVQNPFPHISRLALPDFAEAAVRSGHRAEAQAAVDALGSLSAVTASPWLQGLMARSRALIAEDSAAERAYAASIELLTAAGAPGDLARAHLLYGEWLRRRRRRREARAQLAIAVRAFDALGAAPFATRARNEFAATGEVLPPPTSVTELTPQESLVAGLAEAGKSNQEIAAALFISPNTVDYHLRKVFRKLGITSRRQLLDRHRTDSSS
jgi:DNA-binding CsgD family transcriptional regulator